MRQPSYIYRGYVAIGHAGTLANGKIDGNFAIHALKPFGEIVYRTVCMAECDTPAQALENMCIEAEVWIENHLKRQLP